MRLVVRCSAAALFLAAGCQNLSELPPEPEPTPVPEVRRYQPLDGALGRVQSLNERLHFVVLDYSLTRLPAIGERLEVIRAGEVVGELKVTGPYRNSSVVADIVRGTPRVDDQARPVGEPAAP